MKNILYIAIILMAQGLCAQVQDFIVKGGSGTPYTVSAASGTVDLQATKSITFTPDTWIQVGSDLTARIVDATTATDPYTSTVYSDENYVFTRVFQTAMTSFNATTAKEGDVLEQITYYDGLGRPMQSIGIKASPDKKDIVTHIGYDSIGRQAKDWLPYKVDGVPGGYRNNAETGTNDYYKLHYSDDIDQIAPNPFSEKRFEDAPLNRILEQAAPGEDWKLGTGHGIRMDYGTNITGEVRRFDATIASGDLTYTPTLVANGHFGPSELYKTVVRDENWTSGSDHTTEEFKDKQGRVVLKRTYDASVAHDTYYVYDDHGNLSYVLPPKVDTADGISAGELTELCYQYKYDHRDRLVEKQLPGKGRETIVYDNLDRPVMTKDAVHAWLFTKYDVFGRVAYTGKYTGTETTTGIRAIFENKTAGQNYEQRKDAASDYDDTHYSNTNFPNTDIEVLTVNYYDDYNFDRGGAPASATSYGTTSISNAKGLPTGSRVKVLGTTDWITTVSYYNTKAQGIYIYSRNDYLGTTDIVKSDLDFTGRPKEVETSHTRDGNSAITSTDVLTYDHSGRLIKQAQEINGQATELIAANEYDGLGQLTLKKVGNSMASPLQEIDYTYNVRGWLKDINDVNGLGNDLFGFRINYNKKERVVPSSGNAVAGENLYNGNISEVFWATANPETGTLNGKIKGYQYEYDALNRIKGGTFHDYSAGTGGSQNYYGGSALYSLYGVGYDKNGNLLALKRTDELGYRHIDILTYSYFNTSNRLRAVTENYNNAPGEKGFYDGNTIGDDYAYDANGNLIVDANKGITWIGYNHLNMPTGIYFQGNGKDGGIEYIYTAEGIKLKKVSNDNSTSSMTTTEYAGNYVYENGTLQFFNTAEGYVTPNANNGFDYVYQYKDHLGNIRLSYTDADGNGSIDPATEIIEENNYYPFGLKHKGYNNVVNGTDHKYGFGGKEENDELGLEWLDFSARNYDPALGKWMNLDPLAESMRRHSPYNYAFDNPIRFTDPDGMAPEDIIINGTDEFKKKALENLQALTAELLQIDENGKVTVSDCGGTDNCAVGTDVVSDLINSKKTVTIVETDGPNQTLADNGYSLQNKDGTPGKGSNSTIEFNPEKTEGGVDVNGNTERPTEIGLGHELGHAKDYAEGTTDIGLTDPPILDATALLKGVIFQLQNFEVNAYKFENKLRKERNLPARQINGKKKKGVKYRYY